MTWLRFAASSRLAGIAALYAVASVGACHLLGGTAGLTYGDGGGGSGAGTADGGGLGTGGSEGLANGEPCDDGGQCASSFCAEVCCDAACTDDECSSCTVPGQIGSCAVDVGADCGTADFCDAAGRCATGERDFVLLCGDNQQNTAGRGALQSGALIVTGGTGALGTTLTFGPNVSLSKASGNDMAFVARMNAEQAGEVTAYGEPNGAKVFTHVATFPEPDGGYVVAGIFGGSIVFPPPVGTISSSGGPAVLVVSFKALDQPTWARVIPTAAGIRALAASRDQVAVALNEEAAGKARRRLRVFGKGAGGDVGDVVWDLGNAPEEGELTGLAYDRNGDLWATGWAVSNGFVGDTNADKPLPSSSGRVIPIVVRYSHGLEITVGPVVLGKSVNVRPTALAVGEDSVVIAGGLSDGTLEHPTVDTGEVSLPAADSSGEDPFVLELDFEGDARWGQAWTSDSTLADDAGIKGVARDVSGEVVIVGSLSDGHILFDEDAVTTDLNKETGYVAKILPGGKVAWVASEKALDLSMRWVGIDSEGSSWVTAQTVANNPVFGATPLGSHDLLVMRLDP